MPPLPPVPVPVVVDVELDVVVEEGEEEEVVLLVATVGLEFPSLQPAPSAYTPKRAHATKTSLRMSVLS